MKRIYLPLFAVCALLLAGCLVTSVYPFYTNKELRFEQALVGQWVKVDDEKQTWKFDPQGEVAYKLTYVEGTNVSVMNAHLFKLQNETFLDLFTTEDTGNIEPPPIPAHFLLRVYQLSPTVRMAPLEYDWLLKLLEKDPKALRHHIAQTGEKPDDRRLVLTADTAELQKFVRKHLKTDEAWKSQFELKPHMQ